MGVSCGITEKLHNIKESACARLKAFTTLIQYVTVICFHDFFARQSIRRHLVKEKWVTQKDSLRIMT